ncbi:MAG: TetR/AcrR family transcriptional regulator [Acidimicrobiales bacterium]
MFWHGGYDGSTLDQIAAELGVTKPTLCRTLGDKEAIFAAALEAYHNEHIEPAERYLDEADTLREALESVFALFAERTLTDGLPDGCFMGDSGSSGDFVAGPIAATLGTLQSRLAASVQGRVAGALADGELEPSAEPSAVVQYLFGQFAAISAISRSHPSRTELESVVGYMLDGLPWANTCNRNLNQ